MTDPGRHRDDPGEVAGELRTRYLVASENA